MLHNTINFLSLETVKHYLLNNLSLIHIYVDWGSRLTTTKGSELNKAIQETGGSFHSTGKPTYWPTDPNKIPALLDFFISRRRCV